MRRTLRICSIVFAAPALALSLSSLLAATDWPLRFQTDLAEVVVYQPQPDVLDGSTLTGRAAFSVRADATDRETAAVFGALWFDAQVRTDRDAGQAWLDGIQVSRVRLPDTTDEQAEAFRERIERELRRQPIPIALEGLVASLETAELRREVDTGLSTATPAIRIEYEPAVLVVVDREPQLRAIPNSKVRRVVNSPALILHDEATDTYWLGSSYGWYSAASAKGPWSPAGQPPQAVRDAVPDGAPKISASSPVKPKVLVATEPSELLAFDGQPELAPIGDGALLYATNTASDAFVEVETGRWFVLLAGRWFAAASLDGPWNLVRSDQLPAAFSTIAPDSTKGSVRVHVAGTPEATDAVLDTWVPQTAAITRGPTDLAVTYDGESRFEKIAGTDVAYAVNTESDVLKIDGRFYLCQSGVWYVSDSPEGPWEVSDHRPDAVDSLPPSTPVYRTKYVYVYDVTPSVVWVGYLPGYVGCYPWYGSVVWGTGWYYPAYYGPTYYYPRFWTWGFNVHYYPFSGWSIGFGYSHGFLGLGYYGDYQRYAYYAPCRGWYGPGGYRPPVHYKLPRAGERVGVRPAASYTSRGKPAWTPPQNLYRRPLDGPRRELRPPFGTGTKSPGVRSANRPNDVYVDREGQVFRRRTDGSWEQRDRSGWRELPRATPATPPRAPGTRSPEQPRPGTPPTTRPPSAAPKPPAAVPKGLEREHGARARGAAPRGAPARPRSSGTKAPAPRSSGGKGRR